MMEVHRGKRMITHKCIRCEREQSQCFDTIEAMCAAIAHDPLPEGWRSRSEGLVNNYGITPVSQWRETAAEAALCTECANGIRGTARCVDDEPGVARRINRLEAQVRARLATVPNAPHTFPALPIAARRVTDGA